MTPEEAKEKHEEFVKSRKKDLYKEIENHITSKLIENPYRCEIWSTRLSSKVLCLGQKIIEKAFVDIKNKYINKGWWATISYFSISPNSKDWVILKINSEPPPPSTVKRIKDWFKKTFSRS